MKLTRIEPDTTEEIAFKFDGKSITAASGDTIATALLAAGITATRDTPVTGSPRAPFCMMGACYDCLVEIDGVTAQACMTQAEHDMQVQRPTLPASTE